LPNVLAKADAAVVSVETALAKAAAAEDSEGHNSLAAAVVLEFAGLAADGNVASSMAHGATSTHKMAEAFASALPVWRKWVSESVADLHVKL
jgi:hypothetical protein